jgi:DNA invertase Pin-like site-specific DNA recombinase
VQLDGYIRVSQVGGRGGESFISPTVQREEISHAISSRGAVPGEIFEELNKSGTRASDRVLLMEAVGRIETGISDGLVVARLSRFGRSFEDGVALIGRIQKAGGTLISVREGFDLGTPTGRLVANILFSVAEWEIEARRESWDDARRKRIERGLHICATAPPGYRKSEAGRLVPDSVEGPVIAELFERRLNGARARELARFLDDSPLETKGGGPWRESRIYAILRNSVYMGTAHSGRYEKPGAHEAIVDPEVWHRCQSQPRRPKRWVESLLSGRIRCACCGGMMTSLRVRGDRTTSNVYRCVAEAEDCAAPAQARGEEIDPLVEEFVFREAGSKRPVGGGRKLEEAQAAVVQAEADLAGYRDNVSLARTLGRARFEDGVAARVHLLQRRVLALARVKRARQGSDLDFGRLESEWHTLSWETRRRAVAEMVDLVVVERGGEAVIDRTWVFRRGRGPLLGLDEAVDFRPSLEGAVRLRPHRLWGEKRIEAELREFFAGRERWPAYVEFAKQGRARLHAQVLEWGGPIYWAPRLGIETPRVFGRSRPALVRGALRPFLKGRERWPRPSEFEQAGLKKLHEIVRHNGGCEHWAAEFGLTYIRQAGGRRASWSKQSIERELAEFVAGREFFPRRADFEAAGKSLLYRHMGYCGGITYWAKHFGLRTVVGGSDERRRGGGGETPGEGEGGRSAAA